MMPARSHDIGADGGFTLLDVLVTVALAGLIGSVLLGLAAYGERQRREAGIRRDERQSLLILERTVRTVVSQAPAFIPGKPPLSPVSGDAHEATIRALGLPIFGLSQDTPLRLRRNGSDVMLSWADANGEHRAILARGVDNFSLRYLPRFDDKNTPAWRTDWRTEDGPLSALSFSVRFAASDVAQEAIVPVEAQVPPACLRDGRLPGCAGASAGGRP
jgi:type II secretory pathway pseudopilin PulG